MPVGPIEADAHANHENQADQRVHLEKSDVDPGQVARPAKDVFEDEREENQSHCHPIWQGELRTPTECQKYKPRQEMQDAG